jgi:hypothetical protein
MRPTLARGATGSRPYRSSSDRPAGEPGAGTPRLLEGAEARGKLQQFRAVPAYALACGRAARRRPRTPTPAAPRRRSRRRWSARSRRPPELARGRRWARLLAITMILASNRRATATTHRELVTAVLAARGRARIPAGDRAPSQSGAVYARALARIEIIASDRRRNGPAPGRRPFRREFGRPRVVGAVFWAFCTKPKMTSTGMLFACQRADKGKINEQDALCRRSRASGR